MLLQLCMGLGAEWLGALARHGETGERNERIRTYNFSQNRVTDHRIDLTLYNLPTFIEGEIGEVVSALLANDLKERLAALE